MSQVPKNTVDATGATTAFPIGSSAVFVLDPLTGLPTSPSGSGSLPAGAATAAKQPALGTAGAASADVLTVQGIAGMTPFLASGSVASGVADSGNPLKVGGKYNFTPIVLADLQRGDLQLDLNGNLLVNQRRLTVSDKVSVATSGGDVLATSAQLYDGTNNLPLRSVTPTTGINMLQVNTSEARQYQNWSNGTIINVGTTSLGDFATNNFREMILLATITAVNTGIQFVLQGKDANGNYVTIASTANIVATGSVYFTVGPGLATSVSLGNVCRIQVVVAGTSATFGGTVYFRT